MDNRAIFDPLLRRLQGMATLDIEDLEAIARLPIRPKRVAGQQIVVATGDRPSACCLLIDGFILRSKTTGEDVRQFLSIHQPGDIPDLQSLYLDVMDHDLVTLNECLLGFIPHTRLRDLIRERPKVAEALWRDTLVDAAIFREWIVNVASRPADSRIAHLLLEVYHRLQLIGRAKALRFFLPITQVQLGEATGLSSVHVNRVMQRLRNEGLLTWHRGEFIIQDEPKLRRLSQFDAGYLHNSPSP